MKSPLSKRLGSRISQSDARSLSSIASKSGTSARISTDADMKLSWKVVRRDYVANQAKAVREKQYQVPSTKFRVPSPHGTGLKKLPNGRFTWYSLTAAAEGPAWRLRTRLVILGEKHDVAVATLAIALRFQVRHLREREVKHAALARIHRRKVIWH